jgi:hypothetical protein
MLLSGQVRLLDNEKMRDQFVGLERRTHSNGRESVDDSGAASAHDDLSNVCAAVMVLASKAPERLYVPPADMNEQCLRPSYAKSFGTIGASDLYFGAAGGRPGGAPSELNEQRRRAALADREAGR